MQGSKKLYLRIAVGTAVILISALCLALLPNVLRIESLKGEILSGIQERTGCRVQYQDIDLSLFPRPCVVIRGGSFAHPRGIDGSFDSLTVAPRISSLFSGKFKIASLAATSPRVAMHGSMMVAGGKPLQIPVAQISGNGDEILTTARELLIGALAYLSAEYPGLTLSVDRGEFALGLQPDRPVRFTAVRGSAALNPSRMEARMECASDLFSSLSFDGVLDPTNLTGQGQFSLKDFKPGDLPLNPPIFFPDSSVSVEGSFSGDPAGDVKAHLKVSAPLLAFSRETERHEIRGGFLEGDLEVKSGAIQLTLERLNLDHPKIMAHGKYESSPKGASLVIEAERADATAIRALSLALARDVEIVRNVFNIVREGEVPKIRFTSSAPTPSDLGKPGYSLIEGNIECGRIFIKKIALDIGDVRGNVVIRNGILEGKDLEGRTGSSTTKGGTLVVGLKDEDDAPFHLDVYIDADLADLPPVLQRVVKNKPFLHELSLAKDVRGKGKGRLILGETLGDVQTQVFVDEFEMDGSYGRVPRPIHVSGGIFVLDGERVTLQGVGFLTGKSNLQVRSCVYDFQNLSRLEVRASASKLLIPEDIPIQDDLVGTVSMEALDLTGTPSKPKYLKIQGAIENAKVGSPFGPIVLSKGKYTLEGDRVTLTDMNLAVQDASLVASGSYSSDKKGIKALDLSIRGKVGPEMNRLVFDMVDIPLRLKPPLAIAAGARLVWNRDGQVSFSGSPLAGFDIDLEKNAKELAIRKILIRDEASSVSLAMNVKQRELELDLDGALSGKSLTRLLEKNDLLQGSIKGKLKASLNLDHPKAASATGSVDLFGFAPDLPKTGPVWIEKASIDAGGNHVKILSSEIYYRQTRLDIKGSVGFSPEGYVLDLDLDSDALDWDKLKGEDTSDGTRENGKETVKDPGKTPIEGALRVRAKKFTYGEYTWEPIDAIVTLHEGKSRIELTRTSAICGIATPGTIQLDPFRLKLRLDAKGRELDPAIECFWQKKGLLTGTFDLKGELSVPEFKESVAKSLDGELELAAKDGRIYRFGILSKLFSVINVTEIYRGQLPDLTTEGCAYKDLKMRGKLKDGVCTIDELVIDGPSVRMVWKGTVDLVDKKVDLIALVSPLRTVDNIIKYIPLVGHVLGGALLTIPVQVTGDLQDPYVIPMAPAAVGSEFLGYMKRVFRLPITLLQPLMKGTAPEQ